MKKSRFKKPTKRRKKEESPSFFPDTKSRADKGAANGAFFQAKLEIGSPNDAFEKEADDMASQVVDRGDKNNQKTAFQSQSVQRMEEEEAAAKKIQRQEEEEAAAKKIQRQEEEEPAAKKIQRQEEEEPAAKKIQRQEEEEPAAKKIQRQEEEEPAAKKIQRQEEEEPAAKKIQRQEEEEPAAKKIQRQEEEEPAAKLIQRQSIDSQAQKKSNAASNEKKDKGGTTASANLEDLIQQTKGMGFALPDDVRMELEGEFQADFSQVRIHTDAQAVQMSKMINAYAFTHGYDIYFNQGQYAPYSKEGKRLLAHELTHVVQQKGSG